MPIHKLYYIGEIMISKRYNILMLLTIFLAVLSVVAFGSAGRFTERGWLEENSAACLNCHEDQAATLAGTPHALPDGKELKSSLGSGCVGCHDGWETHETRLRPYQQTQARGKSAGEMVSLTINRKWRPATHNDEYCLVRHAIQNYNTAL
jgi:hypothetical protein